MRAARLLSLLMLLQNRGRMSAARLAAELGVSTRTIYRDVEALATAGVPVYAESGPTGGYQLLDGYRTRLTGLTANEAESLFLNGLAQPAAELGLGADLAAAERKLTAALPTAYREASTRVRQRFHLDATGWYREPDSVPHLLAVAGALWNDQVIEVDYRRWSPQRGEVTRRLNPLGLVLKAGVWYLIAAGDEQPRVYRVSSILRLRPLPECFVRPDDFDLATSWQDNVERHESAETGEVAVVRLTPTGVAALPEVLGPKAARVTRETLGPADSEGWHRAAIVLESVSHAAATVLRFGVDAQAVSPPELVEHLVDHVRSLARLYPG